uniref:Thiamin-phosphate pyrophosphorylase n=1 Tax=Haemoproteus tartakovskyi TaxID=707206 RepID=A0A141MJC8_9APIC|nr:thiamin-phosphate pyrophosphorylase [Haemoproteus tartakovskyi]
MEKCYNWSKWKHWRNWNNWKNWNNNYSAIIKEKTKIDYSLYLVTDDKFIKNNTPLCQSFMNKIMESVLGGVSLLQLRLKEMDDLFFYNMVNQIKEKVRPFHIPIIINDRIDICLATDSDGVHLGKSDMPMSIARRLLGNEKLIGGTINFSNENDLEQAITNNVNYIAHEETLYESKTKNVKTAHISKLKKELQNLNQMFLFLKKQGKIHPSATLPSRILIGGININNIEETMKHFHDTCAGVCVASAIIGTEKENSFMNALQLKLIIDKYKHQEHIALFNMFNSCLNYALYKIKNSNNTEIETSTENEKHVLHNRHRNSFEEKEEEKKEKGNIEIDWNDSYYVCTQIPIKEYLCDTLQQKLKIVHLRECRNMLERINVYLYDSNDLHLEEKNDVRNEGGIYSVESQYWSNWVNEMKKKNIKKNIFICIGDKILHYFRKHFSDDFFQFNFFIVIQNTNLEKLPYSQMLFCLFGEYEMEDASVKYGSNFMYIILKGSFLSNNYKCNRVGVWLTLLLNIHNTITPRILSHMVEGDQQCSIEQTLLKYLSAAITAITYSPKEQHITNFF